MLTRCTQHAREHTANRKPQTTNHKPQTTNYTAQEPPPTRCPQPSDPYRTVAERLQVIMDGMSRDDSNPQQQQMAKFLTSRIGRKVVKQTVMTSVYGVTFIGARAQIHRSGMIMHRFHASARAF